MKNDKFKVVMSFSIDHDLAEVIKKIKGRDSTSRYISRLIENDLDRTLKKEKSKGQSNEKDKLPL